MKQARSDYFVSATDYDGKSLQLARRIYGESAVSISPNEIVMVLHASSRQPVPWCPCRPGEDFCYMMAWISQQDLVIRIGWSSVRLDDVVRGKHYEIVKNTLSIESALYQALLLWMGDQFD